ncbi:MAG TPA: ABC transporter substrate-binding protein [Casimicrobiaceae bacterium]|nr:ABC transporter substrate-binding protein [Casimicrobiaceae bacterium]
MKTTTWLLTGALAVATSGPAFGQATVTFANVGELSGPGASTGTNWKNGVELALKEINAKGGILGKKVELKVYDTQTNPGVAKAMATKAIDDDPYVVMGPGFSGSIIVSMNETKRAEIPNFTSAEASNITMQGNPYIFRTSFSQMTSMPKIAKYIAENAKAKSVAIVWINNDFGKGGRDAIVKELTARNVKIAADIPADPGQTDFSAPVLKAKQSEADVLFPYLTEEESARLLVELRKQGYAKPIIGETTIVEQKVLDLAGGAANGAKGHVGLTAAAPNPLVKSFAEKFEKEWGYKPNHNAMKGYIAVYVVKAVTEKLGKFDRKALAQAMKNVRLSAKDHPGVLMDVAYDEKGDIDRESYLVEVKDGKQVIMETLPRLKP